MSTTTAPALKSVEVFSEDVSLFCSVAIRARQFARIPLIPCPDGT